MYNVSRVWVLFKVFVYDLVGGIGDYFYSSVIFFVLAYFLLLRFPYIYEVGFFFFFLVVTIFPLALCLFYVRLFLRFRSFFSSFVPVGTPLWIAPFVCLAETISYFVRPCVLLIRPFLNLTIGVFAGFSLGSIVLSFGFGFFFSLFCCFFMSSLWR